MYSGQRCMTSSIVNCDVIWWVLVWSDAMWPDLMSSCHVMIWMPGWCDWYSWIYRPGYINGKNICIFSYLLPIYITTYLPVHPPIFLYAFLCNCSILWWWVWIHYKIWEYEPSSFMWALIQPNTYKNPCIVYTKGFDIGTPKSKLLQDIWLKSKVRH